MSSETYLSCIGEASCCSMLEDEELQNVIKFIEQVISMPRPILQTLQIGAQMDAHIILWIKVCFDKGTQMSNQIGVWSGLLYALFILAFLMFLYKSDNMLWPLILFLLIIGVISLTF